MSWKVFKGALFDFPPPLYLTSGQEVTIFWFNFAAICPDQQQRSQKDGQSGVPAGPRARQSKRKEKREKNRCQNARLFAGRYINEGARNSFLGCWQRIAVSFFPFVFFLFLFFIEWWLHHDEETAEASQIQTTFDWRSKQNCWLERKMRPSFISIKDGRTDGNAPWVVIDPTRLAAKRRRRRRREKKRTSATTFVKSADRRAALRALPSP